MTNANVNAMSELEVLNASMMVGFVRFTYYKLDGTLRHAVGTRNHALIKVLLGRDFVDNESYYENGGYFDLTRMAWRKFNHERFGHLEFELNNEKAVAYATAQRIKDAEGIEFVMDAYSKLVDTEFIRSLQYAVTTCEEFGGDEEELFVSVATHHNNAEPNKNLLAEYRKLQEQIDELMRKQMDLVMQMR